MFQAQMLGVPPEIQSIFNEIFRASQEADLIDIGQAFSINGTFTETTQLNVTAPTAANTAAVLATLILYLQRGGATKST